MVGGRDSDGGGEGGLVLAEGGGVDCVGCLCGLGGDVALAVLEGMRAVVEVVRGEVQGEEGGCWRAGLECVS